MAFQIPISNTMFGMDSLLMRFPGLNTTSKDVHTSPTASDDGLSLIYTALPRIIQRRLPQIQSIRNAASTYTIPKARVRSWSTSSASSIRAESPPPSYHASPPTSGSSTEVGDDSDSDDELPELFTSAPSSRTSTLGAVTPTPFHSAFGRHEATPVNTLNTISTRQGLSLLTTALHNPNSPTANTDPLTRRLYIDGLCYILRGLPSDLSQEETTILRSSAPPLLLPPPETKTYHQQSPSSQPTLLHRTFSTLTFYTLLLLTLLLPYLQALLAALYALETRHNLSARFFAQTTDLLRQAVGLLAMAWAANDGALRHACRDFGVWLLRDICGGVDEGVRRAVVGLRPEKEGREV
jgi:hypothetical protein